MLPPLKIEQAINSTVHNEWGRILASLTKSLNDIQLAEDCLQDAVISAMNHWQKNGLPNSPAAWLITTARRKAIDRIRRNKNFASKQPELAYLIELENKIIENDEVEAIPDKRLEMIFTCCHPALEEKTKVALTLRTLCGLTTEEIANAFLDNKDAMAQRLVRAKKKIKAANIPYKIPEATDLPNRLSSVLSVIYLVFNEAYSANGNDIVAKTSLNEEAIRLARVMLKLMPEETEVAGLLSLMLLHDSRRTARSDAEGKMVSLEHQNRILWAPEKIEEGTTLLKQTLPKQRLGIYQLQAAISAVHAESATWQETDWPQISALYDLLYTLHPTPVVKINHAIAVSYASSIETALTMLEEANAKNELDNYQPFYATKADLFARSGNVRDAKHAYKKAIDLSASKSEKEFLQNKLSKI